MEEKRTSEVVTDMVTDDPETEYERTEIHQFRVEETLKGVRLAYDRATRLGYRLPGGMEEPGEREAGYGLELAGGGRIWLPERAVAGVVPLADTEVQRMYVEEETLGGRLTELAAFVFGKDTGFNGLGDEMKTLLRMQLGAMGQYREALQRRITLMEE